LPITSHGRYDEKRTLYRVIRLVSSSLELGPMLEGIVDLTTEASGCHACFIYLLEDGQLTMRAASPVYAEAVGKVRMRIDEGLTGWVARHRTPEFIRENAMADPRMKYFPELEEERFQSMVAVPILARSGETLGVIVLHTEAPREFTEETLKLLVHIASLVSGAIENAQLYDQQRRRVDLLTRVAALAQELAGAEDVGAIGRTVARGARSLLSARVCQLLRVDERGGLELIASAPEDAAAPPALSASTLLLAAVLERGEQPRAAALWPELDVSDLLLVPLSAGGERVGLLCAGGPPGRAFAAEEAELARAIAHLAAIAIKRAELIERLTSANTLKDMFEALAAGATAFAAEKAAALRLDLGAPYAIVCVEPPAGGAPASAAWHQTAAELGRELQALAPRAAVEPGPGAVRALLALGPRQAQRHEELLAALRELGRARGAAIGISDPHRGAADGARAYREALDAAAIGRRLLADGGAIAYGEVGAYRYLVHIAADEAPRDRMHAAVEKLIAYDHRRQTALLDTLERYLAARCAVADSARTLYIHPNTLRQRLARIEELTGLDLARDDLLSLELAIKLARLHGAPRGQSAARPDRLNGPATQPPDRRAPAPAA
jgi:GAF domain-containing protein